MEADADLLDKLAAEMPCKFERAAGIEIARFRRPAGKGEQPRIGGGRGHFAEQERAVGTLERRRREKVADIGVGKIPIAPGT